MKRRSIALIAIVVVAIATTVGVLSSFLPVSPTIKVEVNPPPPLKVKQGGNFSLGISVRNEPGFKAEAKHVRGELELPEGFIEESLRTRVRQLIFGTISPGDASHYGLTIVVSKTVEVGEYHAKLTIWGANIPRKAIDIEIIVLPP